MKKPRETKIIRIYKEAYEIVREMAHMKRWSMVKVLSKMVEKHFNNTPPWKLK